MLGAVFGKVMEESGCARAIAKLFANRMGPKHAIVAVSMSTALLTYGGVSMFVVPFAVYPFAYVLFRESDILRRLIPASTALGSFCFSMTAMPGSPQIQNIIPARYFETTLYSAPIFGLVGAAIMCFGGPGWLTWRQRKLMAAGEGFGRLDARATTDTDDGLEVSPYVAMAPLLTVLVLNFLLTLYFNTWDNAAMQGTSGLPLASATVPVANWAVITSLVAGILLAIALCHKQFKARRNILSALNAGTVGSLLAIMNTASTVGFGNVVSTLPGFSKVQEFIIGIAPDNPLISEAIIINVLAGITGSASGGMSIALEAMGAKFLEMGAVAGITPELLHRVAAMASGGFDSLPHNGAIITLLVITGMTHRESYPDIGRITVLLPFVTTFSLVAVWSIFGFSMQLTQCGLCRNAPYGCRVTVLPRYLKRQRPRVRNRQVSCHPSCVAIKRRVRVMCAIKTHRFVSQGRTEAQPGASLRKALAGMGRAHYGRTASTVRLWHDTRGRCRFFTPSAARHSPWRITPRNGQRLAICRHVV